MISRTIETVEVAGKTMFYEICVEDIEFHILGQTVKTNKWLRFEEWQQIYEQISKSFATYSISPPDFTIKSFTVGNYIRVEIELFPIESCYGDLFKVKLENCLQDFLQIRIRQIALGSNLEEIQQAERNHEKIAAAMARKDKRDIRKNRKKRRTGSLSEYRPVAVKKNIKIKNVPLYKPSKLIPDLKEYDEPYSPKPVHVSEDSVDDYTPYTISSSDKDSATPSVVPTYKPSTIVKKTYERSSEESTAQNALLLNEEDVKVTKRLTSAESTGNEEIIKPTTPSPVFVSDEKTIVNESDDKHAHAANTYRSKRSKFSQDLFADSEEELSKSNDLGTVDDVNKLCSKPLKRKRCDKDSEEIIYDQKSPQQSTVAQTVTGDDTAGKDTTKVLVAERRSSRKLLQKLHENVETSNSRSTQEQTKPLHPVFGRCDSKKRTQKEKKDIKNKKTSNLINLCPLNQKKQDPGSSKKEDACSQNFPMPSLEVLQQNKIKYEREIEMLENFSKDLKEIIKPPPSVEIIDLNDMKVKELIGTFKEFKPKLDKQFEKYKKQKRFQCSPEAEELYLLVLNIIDRNRVISLMDHLQSIYEPDCDGVPTYTDLFMNLMAPEWVLRIFMKKFNLNREGAIKQIKMQRDAEALN